MSMTLAVLPWIIGAGMVVVLGVLFAGVITMSRGGEINARHGNRLMRLRVISQGAVVALLLMYFLLHSMN